MVFTRPGAGALALAALAALAACKSKSSSSSSSKGAPPPAKPSAPPRVFAAANLAPDASYGTKGRASLKDVQLEDGVVLDDGTVVVSVEKADDSPDESTAETTTILMAVDGHGAPIAGFGEAGALHLRDHHLSRLATDAAQHLILYGAMSYDDTAKVEVVRLGRDGKPDAGFGPNHDGVVALDLGRAVSAAALFTAGDGALTIVGDRGIPADGQPSGFWPREGFVAHLGADGSFDAAHGLTAFTAVPGQTRLVHARQTGDGKILVSGYSTDKDHPLGWVARVTAAGVLDPAFGDHGVAIVRDPQIFTAWAFAIDAKDRPVLGAMQLQPGLRGPIVLARFTADGKLDPTFARQGTWLGTDDDDVTDLLASADGGVIAVGVAQNRQGDDTHPTTMLARFDDHGAPAPKQASADETWTVARALVDAQGRVVVIGGVSRHEDPDDTSRTTDYGVIERYAAP